MFPQRKLLKFGDEGTFVMAVGPFSISDSVVPLPHMVVVCTNLLGKCTCCLINTNTFTAITSGESIVNKRNALVHWALYNYTHIRFYLYIWCVST